MMSTYKMLALWIINLVLLCFSAIFEWKVSGYRAKANNTKNIEKALIVWWTTLTYSYAMVLCSIILSQWIITAQCCCVLLICVLSCEELWKVLKKNLKK